MRCTAILLLALSPALALAQDSVVGEWNLDESACEHTRITYTDDGRHESLQHGADGWAATAAGSYRHEGNTIVVDAGGVEQTLEIVELTADRLKLRNPDPAQMAALGVEHVTFVRCPPRED